MTTGSPFEQSLGNGNGVSAGTHRVHAHPPHPSQREHTGKRGGRVVALLSRPWASFRICEQPTKEGLSGDTSKHRPPEDVEFLEPLQHVPVVFTGLGEPKARIDDHLVGSYASPDGFVELRSQLGYDLSHDVGVGGFALHVLRVAAPVHADIRDT